jgi:hypothetical protein
MSTFHSLVPFIHRSQDLIGQKVFEQVAVFPDKSVTHTIARIGSPDVTISRVKSNPRIDSPRNPILSPPQISLCPLFNTRSLPSPSSFSPLDTCSHRYSRLPLSVRHSPTHSHAPFTLSRHIRLLGLAHPHPHLPPHAGLVTSHCHLPRSELPCVQLIIHQRPAGL